MSQVALCEAIEAPDQVPCGEPGTPVILQGGIAKVETVLCFYHRSVMVVEEGLRVESR